jgi:intein/homing endonuclease
MSMRQNASLHIGDIARRLKRLAVEQDMVVILIWHIYKEKIETPDDLDQSLLRDCLPSGQLVYSNGERIPIEDVYVGMPVVSKGSSFRLQNDNIKDVWKAGIKDIYKITTERGYELECSDGHQFYAMTYKKGDIFTTNQGTGINGWTQLKNLQIGQKIAVVNKYPDIPGAGEISPVRAFILGWIIGDGHVTNLGHTEITVHTEYEAKFLKRIIDKEFSLNCKYSKYTNKDAYRFYLTKGKFGNSSNGLVDFIRDLDYKTKSMPGIIFRQPNNVVAKILSGLFHADGSVFKCKCGVRGSYIKIKFDTINEQLARDVKHLLLRLGILSRIYYYKNMWSVSITGSNIIKFHSLIGFRCYKKMKYYNLRESWNPKDKPRKSDLYFDKIKSIEYIGRKDTYDLEVCGKHKSLRNRTYCVNDIICHNSGMVAAECDAVLMTYRSVSSNGVMSVNESGLMVCVTRRTGEWHRFIPTRKVGKYIYELDFVVGTDE